MTSAAFKIKLAILATASVLLFLINRPSQIEKSEEQSRYESWLASIEAEQNRDKDSSQLRATRLELKSNYPELPADWRIVASGNSSGDSKILRLLQLAREANLFSVDQNSRDAGSAALQLEIQSDHQKFRAVFSKNFLENNVQAQSLLKLFEIYSRDQQSSQSLTQQ